MARSLAEVERMLSGGDWRSLQAVENVIAVVLADSAAFESPFECLFNDDEVVRMRAADGLEKIARHERPPAPSGTTAPITGSASAPRPKKKRR